MTTVRIELPDALAAGLLTTRAMEAILSEQLKRQAADALREMWAQAPPEELTPEIEQMIDEAVQAARATRRQQSAH